MCSRSAEQTACCSAGYRSLRAGGRSLVVPVDELLHKEEIVIKNLGAFLQGIGPFSGATVTGQGRVILLLDSMR